MAIADNSEVEDLSDGEENDPAVDEYIPHDMDFMPVEQQPDDSEGDSDEGCSPPADAYHHISEDSDSQNESEPQHPQVHKRGRKRQRVENDGEPELRLLLGSTLCGFKVLSALLMKHALCFYY